MVFVSMVHVCVCGGVSMYECVNIRECTCRCALSPVENQAYVWTVNINDYKQVHLKDEYSL